MSWRINKGLLTLFESLLLEALFSINKAEGEQFGCSK